MVPQVKAVVMRSLICDYGAAFRDSLARLGIDAEIVDLPLFELDALSPRRVREVRRALAPSSPGQQVIYCPGLIELFLSGPHHSLHFSGYRDWHDERHATVLPHPWSVHAAIDPARLGWQGKPPLAAGFMGSVYRNAALVRLARRLPAAMRQRLLLGRYLRHAGLTAAAYAGGIPVRFALAFPRAESLDALKAQTAGQSDFAVTVIDTGGFTGRDDAKARYVEAMLASTYVLCPRGSENFSFRAFETLMFGRVPVIIDTDMVLPRGIPWEEVAVIVPYDRLDRIAEIIRDDHARHDAAGFARRQQVALSAMEAMADGRWLDGELARIVAPGSRG